MSRISQYIAFINSEELPSKFQRMSLYTHLTITDEMVKERNRLIKMKGKSNMEELKIETLTLEILKDMEPGVFAQGEGTYPALVADPIKWVAVRGGIHDWALYYHHAYHSFEYVKKTGDKSFTESIIRDLVPCDDQAWEMYRL